MRLGVPFIYIFVYICWCYRMVALVLCCNSIAPALVKMSVLALFVIINSLVNWCVGRPTWVSSCCFGGLSCDSLFYFAASWLQSMTRR